MSLYSPVMAVLANEGLANFANQLANALGYPFADVVIGTPREAAQVLMTRDKGPQYIFLDIGNRQQDVLPEIDAMAECCQAGTKVVVVGTTNDVQFYRALRQRGVLEYFTHPAQLPDVRAALVFDGMDGHDKGGKVISFMSAASGDGSSTVALNCAYAMAKIYGKQTVLIDMDYQFGMIAKNLDLNSTFGIRELFEHPDRGIDNTLLQRMTAKYRDNLHVIAAPNDLRVLPSVSPETVRELIQTVRRDYDCVVIDLPHLWVPWTAAALSSSTKIVTVAQLWLRSVTHAARLMGIWRKTGIKDDDITMVINRSGAKFKEAIGAKDFERVAEHPINFYLANDIKTVVTAENQGHTILEAGNSQLANQLRELAGMVIGLQAADFKEPQQEKGFPLFRRG
jgi:pilus assembly protein CpaE